MTHKSRHLVAICVPALLAVFASPARAQAVDIIRGRVTGPENQPLTGAQVTVTTISGAVSRQARTAANGRYTVTFPGGDGDYLVAVNAIGYGPARLEVKRVADEDILIADVKLSHAAQVLGSVRVIGDRTRPLRNDGSPDIGGTEQSVSRAAIAAGDQGNIAAMASSIAGVLLVPGRDGDPSGFSVLGLDPSQNTTTLNGQMFGGADVPRDAAVSSSLTTSPYDVTRGGFSGANFNLRTQSGSNLDVRTNSAAFDSPRLQWTDPAARALGQDYANVSIGGRASGPLRYNAAFYNVGYQAGRRSNELQGLLTTSPLGLRTAGIAADSVTRLTEILRGLGIPAAARRIPRNRTSDQGSILGSFDVAPPTSRGGTALNLTVNGSWNRMSPASNLANEVPAHGSDRMGWNGVAQLRHSTYFGFGVLSETNVSASNSAVSATPYLAAPTGTVRINSTFDDGTSGVKLVGFGGGPLNLAASNRVASASNLVSWISENNTHRVKLSTELRRESYVTDQRANEQGAFSFNSLGDLEAGRVAAYARTLNHYRRTGGEWVGAASIGDAYRPTNNLQLQYGLRLDANAFTLRPVRNPAVESLFGVRNDATSDRILASPRVGFSWSYGKSAQIPGFDGAFRGPRAVMRGGIGLFQGVPSAQLLASAIDNTGRAEALQQVLCTGIAAPVPHWAEYMAGAPAPLECANGASSFASGAPNVVLLGSAYRAPRSIRSNLQWSGAVVDNRLFATIDLTASFNEHQPGVVDLNFAPVQQFALVEEGGRPVFVLPAAIDPTTGVIAAKGARVSPAFNRVTEHRSDLRSMSRQVRASVFPAAFSTRLQWSAAYVYTNVRERARGFSATTAGNPFDVESARSNLDSRHQVQYSLSYNAFDLLRLSWFGGFRSGTPFTPLVAADVNGDGYLNDRAYIFGADARDPAIAAAMQTLTDRASASVKRCVERQAHAVAARNSCEGPWTSQANLAVAINPVKVGLPQRASVSLSIQNPLAAADLMLHGSTSSRGWGQFAIPDENLLYVRGFDRGTNRFRYEVNQRFGASSPALTAFRVPAAITVMLRVDVGPTREQQSLVQQLKIGRRAEGDKLPEGVFKSIYSSGGLSNPFAAILREADSLRLTGPQADSIASMNRWYLLSLDSIWTPIAHAFSSLPDQYDDHAAYALYKRGREASVDLLRRGAPLVRVLLDESQKRKLPALVTSYLDDRYLASIRSGTAGSTLDPFGTFQTSRR